MDSALIPKGVKRCPMWQFLLGLAALWAHPCVGRLCHAAVLVQRAEPDQHERLLRFRPLDLGGPGRYRPGRRRLFFSGLLKYILGKDELKHIINYAVLIGFICYSSALLILAIDVGQPCADGSSSGTPTSTPCSPRWPFCLSCYFAVLTIEYIPLILENRQLDKVPFFHNLSHNMHGAMAVFAATGAFLSFFHQGSLGGVAGVLFGRPFAYPGGTAHLALDLFPLYLVGGRLRP
jgi:hypothetical protein